MEMTTMTLKVQYLTKLEDGMQIRAGWYVTTPFCPGVVFATGQEALAYGRTEELRQELMDRVRAMSFDELRAYLMQGRAGGRFPKQTQHLILCRSLPPGPGTRPCIGQQFGQIVSHK